MDEIEKYKGRPVGMVGRNQAEIATYDFLDSQGITYETLTHPAAYTMEECN